MSRNSYLKFGMGALLGLTMTGGWLTADLLLPEPWGDYLLFSAMAVVNVAMWWRLIVLSDKEAGADSISRVDDAKSAFK